MVRAAKAQEARHEETEIACVSAPAAVTIPAAGQRGHRSQKWATEAISIHSITVSTAVERPSLSGGEADRCRQLFDALLTSLPIDHLRPVSTRQLMKIQ